MLKQTSTKRKEINYVYFFLARIVSTKLYGKLKVLK